MNLKRLLPKVLRPTDVTYCLSGVAERDPEELVCMFFNDPDDVDDFIAAVPMARHQVMVLVGVDYNAMTVIPEIEV